MKRNAVVRIVLWSITLAVSLSTLFILLYVPGAGSRMQKDTSAETCFPAQSHENFNIVRVNAGLIQEIEIEWLAGSIMIRPTEADEIAFREEDIGGSEKTMQWKIQGDKLIIRYAEDKKFSLKAGLDWKDEHKNLIVEVPADWACRSLKVAAAAASLNANTLTIREMEFDGASGACSFDNCTVEKLDLDTASGNVRFTGSLQQLDCDAVSADILLELNNVPRSIDLDTASGDLEVTLPADAGFTVTLDAMSSEFQSDFDTISRNGSYIAGNGRCSIDVDAMSGDVTIRKGA